MKKTFSMGMKLPIPRLNYGMVDFRVVVEDDTGRKDEDVIAECMATLDKQYNELMTAARAISGQ